MAGFTPQQREMVAAFMADKDVPGVAVAIVADRRVVAQGGFGMADLQHGRAPTAETLWPVASITKSFTAVAVMQLVQAGRMDLDAPVTDYLPSLRVADSETTRRLTLRRLLTHTSGLGRTGHQDRTREEPVNPFPTREALVAALGDVVPQVPVGRAFSYSNESYVVAGRAVECVRGKPLEACFLEDIMQPAGMQRSAVYFDAWRADPDRAFLYASEGIGPYGSGEQHGRYQVVNLVQDYQTFLSTGGVISTAGDLARYQIATMDYLHSSLGLTGASLDHMHGVQHQFGDSGWGYGLGYRVMPAGALRVIGHSGGLPGVSTYSLMVPAEGNGVVVLTNRSDVKAMVLAERLMVSLRGPLWRDDPSEPLPITSAWGSPGPDDLAPYLGSYRFRRGPAQVRAGERGVVVSTPSRYDGPVHDVTTCRVARDRFVSLSDSAPVEFLRNDADDVVGFLHSGYLYRRE
jgi:CubicO group peptidase (beta-lactamase class C family)